MSEMPSDKVSPEMQAVMDLPPSCRAAFNLGWRMAKKEHAAALAAARAEEREAAKVLEAALTILANNHGHCGHCGKLGDSPSLVSCGKRECTWEPPEPQGIAVLALERAAAIRTTDQEGEG